MRLVDQTAFRIVTVILAMLVMACGKDNGKKPDTDPEQPVIAQLILNDGVSYTLTRDITVAAICAGDAEPEGIRISEDPSFDGALWVDYHLSGVSYQLSAGDGPKAVHVQVRDAGDRVSSTATAEIVLAKETTVVGLSPVLGGKSGNLEASQPRVFELWVANADAMYSGRFQLSYDQSRIEVTQVEVNIAGHILGLTGASVVVSDGRFDEPGTVQVGALGQMSGFTGVTGSGPFARITFAPVGNLSTSVPVVFEHESTTGIWVHQEGAPPIPQEGILYVDGNIAP